MEDASAKRGRFRKGQTTRRCDLVTDRPAAAPLSETGTCSRPTPENALAAWVPMRHRLTTAGVQGDLSRGNERQEASAWTTACGPPGGRSAWH